MLADRIQMNLRVRPEIKKAIQLRALHQGKLPARLLEEVIEKEFKGELKAIKKEEEKPPRLF